MHIKNHLKSIGLHDSEITIYLSLLEHGLSTPPQIAKRTGIARTNTYNTLVNLMTKGLITEQKTGKRKAYLALDPEALLLNLETKKQTIEGMLPELRSLYKKQKNKPTVTFYEDWEQVKQIYWQVFDAEEVYAIGSTKHLTDMQKGFFEKFMKGLKEKNIVMYDVLTYFSGQEIAGTTKHIMKGLYDYAVIPKEYQELQTDILIWNDNVALISLEEPIFGTVLTNPFLAETFKTLAKIIHKSLKNNT